MKYIIYLNNKNNIKIIKIIYILYYIILYYIIFIKSFLKDYKLNKDLIWVLIYKEDINNEL